MLLTMPLNLIKTYSFEVQAIGHEGVLPGSFSSFESDAKFRCYINDPYCAKLPLLTGHLL